MNINYIEKNYDKIKVFIPDDVFYNTKTKKKYSAHIIVRYNGGHCGGIDPHIISLCQEQKRNSDILPMLIIVSRCPSVVDDYKDLGIAYVNCLDCKNNFDTVKQLGKIFNDFEFSILHSHGYSTNYFLYLLKHYHSNSWGKVKTVVTCHGWVEFNIQKKIITFFDFFTYSMADALISVSEKGLYRIERYKNKNKIVKAIHNGIYLPNKTYSETEIQKFKSKYNIPKEKKIICYVGRLDGEKRVDRFINFGYELLKKRSDVYFLIVGKGSLEKQLKNQILSLGISKNFKFTGEIFPPTIVYQISEFLFLPSDTEGIPMCVLECMSNKKTVLATNVGGLPEIIENNIDGYLFDKNDINTMVFKANELLNDSKKLKAMCENAYKKVKNDYSVKQMQEKTISVYNAVLSK